MNFAAVSTDTRNFSRASWQDIATILLCALSFFLPMSYSFAGRAYDHLVLLNTNEIFFLQILLIPSIAFSILIILIKKICGNKILMIPYGHLSFFLILISWFIAATASAGVNYQKADIFLFYSATYLSMILIYIALIDYHPTQKRMEKIIFSAGIGTLIVFIGGLEAYYEAWGIPTDAHALIYSHFDLKRMENYMSATYGNTSNTAAYLSLMMPIFFSYLWLIRSKPWLKTLLIACLLFGSFHLIITQSRAALISLFIGITLTVSIKGKRYLIFYLLALLSVMCLTYFFAHDFTVEIFSRLWNVLTLNAEQDGSVSERESAMFYGFRLFWHNPLFGIGPGRSLWENPLTAAHQFNIQQASETGILGLVASIFLVIYTFRNLYLILTAKKTKNTFFAFIFIIGPVVFLMYAVLANVPLAVGIANVWLIFLILFLLISKNVMKKISP